MVLLTAPEAGDEGQAAARARRTVAEEVAVAGGWGVEGAGGEIGDVDLGGGHACLEQEEPVGRPQVEQPAVRGVVRAEESRRGRAEGAGHGLVDVGTDLVAGGRGGGADSGDDLRWAGTEGLHRGQRRGGNAGHGAAPPGVHAGQHAGHRVVQHDRHAVRGQDGEHDTGRPSDERVDVWYGVIERERAAPGVRFAHDPHAGPVHLAGEHEILRASA